VKFKASAAELNKSFLIKNIENPATVFDA